MTSVAVPPSGGYASRKGLVGWAMFDFATQPHATLLTTFVFAPFFAASLASTPAMGQSLWGYATGVTGIIIALLSPVLGSMADYTGYRKRWIAAFGLLLCLGSFSLWYAVPGNASAVWIALIGYSVATIGVEFAAAFNNAMMPRLVPPEKLGRLSGYAWAFGYVGGLISLVLVLGFLAASPESGKTLLGQAPLFGLDAASREGDRASGPLTALWFLIFVLPMFLFTPDTKRGMPLGAAVAKGLTSVRETLTTARKNSNVFRFLVGNMIYMDGLNALYGFGGIFAAGIFGWSIIELGVFGILLNITAVIGAALGGWFDDKVGPKRVISFCVCLLLVLCTAMLSLSPSKVFFIFDVVPRQSGSGLFSSTAELWCLVIGGLIGAVGGPLQAASRTMLIRLVPEEHVGEYFGLLSLSGKVTSFVAPTVVATATLLSHDQRMGLAVLTLFFFVGYLILRKVEGGHALKPIRF